MRIENNSMDVVCSSGETIRRRVSCRPTLDEHFTVEMDAMDFDGNRVQLSVVCDVNPTADAMGDVLPVMVHAEFMNILTELSTFNMHKTIPAKKIETLVLHRERVSKFLSDYVSFQVRICTLCSIYYQVLRMPLRLTSCSSTGYGHDD